jgi:hypothetical protein
MNSEHLNLQEILNLFLNRCQYTPRWDDTQHADTWTDPGAGEARMKITPTFLVLKKNEEQFFDEYGTGRLVMDAWELMND